MRNLCYCLWYSLNLFWWSKTPCGCLLGWIYVLFFFSSNTCVYSIICGCMYVWVYPSLCKCGGDCMNVWISVCMTVWMNESLGVWVYQCINLCMYGCMKVSSSIDRRFVSNRRGSPNISILRLLHTSTDPYHLSFFYLPCLCFTSWFLAINRSN